MFEDFALSFVAVNGVTLRVRHGGSGPPVLLVHGHPRTHVTWHKVAPLLAKSHTVVCPDSRGYGMSSKPETTSDHSAHPKRATAKVRRKVHIFSDVRACARHGLDARRIVEISVRVLASEHEIAQEHAPERRTAIRRWSEKVGELLA